MAAIAGVWADAIERCTHRPTWPDHRANDRVVLRDGEIVARVYQHEHGPQAGEWSWFGHWTGYDNTGSAETLDEALNTVQERCSTIQG